MIFALMFGFRFIPAPDPITPYGMAVIGIFLGLIYGWTVSAGNMVWPSMLAMAAMATTQYGGGADVMAAAFGNYTVVLNFTAGFIMGPLAVTGVGDYLMAAGLCDYPDAFLCHRDLCRWAGRLPSPDFAV